MQLLPYTRDCFVCGAENSNGLRLKFHAHPVSSEPSKAPQIVRTEFTPQPVHAGFKQIVHGGILATLLDEAMFWAAALSIKNYCVSAEMSVRYKRKAIVGRRLIISGMVTEEAVTSSNRQKRLVSTRGEILDADTGELLTSATGKFLPIDERASGIAVSDFYPDPDAMKVFPVQ